MPEALAIGAIALTVMGGLSQAAGQRREGEAQQQAADYQAQVERNNAQIAENNRVVALQNAENAREQAEVSRRAAETTRLTGEAAVQAKQQETAVRLGKVRAAYAAAGVDVASGSPLGTVEDTARVGALDALTIRSNVGTDVYKLIQEGHQFDMAAYNYEAQATGFAGEASNRIAQSQLDTFQGKYAKEAGETRARSTILGTAGKVAGQGYSFWGGGGTGGQSTSAYYLQAP